MNLTTLSAAQLLSAPPRGRERAAVDLRTVLVIGVTGDVDLYSGPALERAFEDLLSPEAAADGVANTPAATTASDVEDLSGSVRAVVVDLTGVEFIDSYAVGVLVRGHHLARRGGRAYALAATHPMIHKLFDITGLARVLPLHPDVASAAASFPGTRPGASA